MSELTSDQYQEQVQIVADAIMKVFGAGLDTAEFVSQAASRVARTLGGSEALVSHRPGSWEAAHLRGLASLADVEELWTKD
jgi:hypothetical protein